jgi:hypothetical protein
MMVVCRFIGNSSQNVGDNAELYVRSLIVCLSNKNFSTASTIMGCSRPSDPNVAKLFRPLKVGRLPFILGPHAEADQSWCR